MTWRRSHARPPPGPQNNEPERSHHSYLLIKPPPQTRRPPPPNGPRQCPRWILMCVVCACGGVRGAHSHLRSGVVCPSA